jgi:hypothetical protein
MSVFQDEAPPLIDVPLKTLPHHGLLVHESFRSLSFVT